MSPEILGQATPGVDLAFQYFLTFFVLWRESKPALINVSDLTF
jgi:hypothetical protein